jgi:hypothetical protein
MPLPPKRNPRRRNARPEWRALPAAGRPGRAPAWPLSGRMPAGVGGARGAWRYLWSLPQAVVWEELALVRTVARYAVALVAAEQPGATPYLLSEVRQLEDRLGLNAVAMRRLMWEVTDSAGNVLEEGERVAARWPAWTPTASGRGERRAEVSRAARAERAGAVRQASERTP